MGSGFKDFTAGDVLTAADVDGYLMRQGVMTFADSSARDTALTGVLDEGMHAYLEDVNQLTYYTGSAWVVVYSDWTSFTPTWNNLTLGNGVSSGAYKYVAGDLYVKAEVTFGTTTAFPAATGISLTLPNSETHINDGLRHVGTGYWSNGGNSWLVTGVTTGGATTTVDIRFFNANNDAFAVFTTSGWTEASGDVLDVSIGPLRVTQ